MHGTLFIQSPPVLGNQYRDDAFLQSYLRRQLPATMLSEIEPSLAAAGKQALAAIEHVFQWLSQNDDPRRLQANARRLAMTLGRALELSLLIEHAGCGGAPADTASHAAAAAVSPPRPSTCLPISTAKIPPV